MYAVHFQSFICIIKICFAIAYIFDYFITICIFINNLHHKICYFHLPWNMIHKILYWKSISTWPDHHFFLLVVLFRSSDISYTTKKYIFVNINNWMWLDSIRSTYTELSYVLLTVYVLLLRSKYMCFRSSEGVITSIGLELRKIKLV